MARETKAQREARMEEQRTQELNEMVAAWPARLMKNLERATGHAMKLYVVEGMFRVIWLDEWNDQEEVKFRLAPTDFNDWRAMDKLEYALYLADLREEQYRHKQELRTSALKKLKETLTKEEREELGL